MYMLAFVQISLKEGISKKIVCQAQALSKINDVCDLLCLSKDNHFLVINCRNGEIKTIRDCGSLDLKSKSLNRINPFIEMALKNIDMNDKRSIYIRHMVPSLRYIFFLKKISSRKIFTEIPTYPYFYEQISSSDNKIMTVARIFYEILFWPLIYIYVDKIVAITCRSSAHRYKKMNFITNGYCVVNDIKLSCKNNSDSLVLIGVGKIQKYHGYEKVIEAIHNYTGNKRIKFYIVGNGETQYLKDLVDLYKLKDRVIFTGIKTDEELEILYRKADIGVGTMALEMRKADIDTGIKIIDYYLHGLPVISSGECPQINDDSIPQPYMNTMGKINFDNIYEWMKIFDKNSISRLIYLTKIEFSWEKILRRVLDEKKN